MESHYTESVYMGSFLNLYDDGIKNSIFMIGIIVDVLVHQKYSLKSSIIFKKKTPDMDPNKSWHDAPKPRLL